MDRLISLVSLALNHETDMGLVAFNSYCTIIEASLHSRGVWDAFISHSTTGSLHGALLLSDRRSILRESVAKTISSVCGGGLSPTSAITETDTAASFWHLISNILSQTVQLSGQTAQ